RAAGCAALWRRRFTARHRAARRTASGIWRRGSWIRIGAARVWADASWKPRKRGRNRKAVAKWPPTRILLIHSVPRPIPRWATKRWNATFAKTWISRAVMFLAANREPKWGGGRNSAVLPRVEVDNLITAVFEAVDLAAEGLVADGYQVLLLGKQRALEAEA